MNNLDSKQSLPSGCLTVRKLAYQREFETLALQSLHDEYDPHYEECQANHHRNKNDEQWSKSGNKEQHEANSPECRANYHSGQARSEALKRMKAYEAVFTVGLKQKKYDRRQK